MIFRLSRKLVPLGALVALVSAAAVGCGGRETIDRGETQARNAEANDVRGRVETDGSSTVAPLTQLAAERFREVHPNADVTVGVSGTGGGFERFCRGETDIANASRPIKEDEEVPLCKENGIEFTELRVATDALTVVVNPENDWVDCLTVEQLERIWQPGSKIENWNQIDPSFPDEPLALAGPGTDSGTFDYFTEAIGGEEAASRSDYTASEDDNVIVQAVAGERGALGYFGFSYYDENADRLKALAIDNGDGCVEPSADTAQSGEYTPLARPLFIYVKNESLEKPQVEAFLRFYLENAIELAQDALYVPLTDEQKRRALDQLEQAVEA